MFNSDLTVLMCLHFTCFSIYQVRAELTVLFYITWPTPTSGVFNGWDVWTATWCKLSRVRVVLDTTCDSFSQCRMKDSHKLWLKDSAESAVISPFNLEFGEISSVLKILRFLHNQALWPCTQHSLTHRTPTGGENYVEFTLQQIHFTPDLPRAASY